MSVSSNKPQWAVAIMNRYGNFQGFCNVFSYGRIDLITRDPLLCYKRPSPSLTRVDVTYGNGSSAIWLYDVLQAVFAFFGVNNERFSKEQILDLARTIANNYKFLTVAEILLFISQFKAGKYGRFYGGDSYALVITESLNGFCEERHNYMRIAEQEEEERREAEEARKHPPMSREEWIEIKTIIAMYNSDYTL